jgi:hypothetical protein
VHWDSTIKFLFFWPKKILFILHQLLYFITFYFLEKYLLHLKIYFYYLYYYLFAFIIQSIIITYSITQKTLNLYTHSNIIYQYPKESFHFPLKREALSILLIISLLSLFLLLLFPFSHSNFQTIPYFLLFILLLSHNHSTPIFFQKVSSLFYFPSTLKLMKIYAETHFFRISFNFF